jgi:hypothetical protein
MSTPKKQPTVEQTKRKARRTIYARLAELSIETITAVYCGSDDSGCIDHIITVPSLDAALAATVELPVQADRWNATSQRYEPGPVTHCTMPLKNAIEVWAYDLLEEHHPGWEIDAGSDGQIIIDVKRRRATVNHTYYSHTSDHQVTVVR